MASLDKTSVKAEVSRFKTDFKQLCDDGKITDENKAPLMMSMFMIVELILSIFLEKTSKKTTRIPA